MNSKIYSSTILGVNGLEVQVETRTGRGLPTIKIVGRTDKTIQEAKERAVAAIKSIRLGLKPAKTRINLAPSEIPKVGSGTDLAIALGIILAQKPHINKFDLKNRKIFAFGEIGLDGKISCARGIVQFLEVIKNNTSCSRANIAFLPKNSLANDILNTLPNVKKNNLIYFISSISEAIEALNKKSSPKHFPNKSSCITDNTRKPISIDNIRGQYEAKRALLIAAAGRHHIMLAGPIGIGKTLLARSILSIYPRPESEDIFEILKVQSSYNADISAKIPFEEISKTTTKSILLGNRASMSIGKVTQAHCGILLADELGEFKSSIINLFRKPLEDNSITLQFRNHPVQLPCKFQLIATTNLCPCGKTGLEEFSDGQQQECTCSAYEKFRYSQKIPPAILNRIDMIVYLGNQIKAFKNLDSTENRVTMKACKKSIAAAKKLQKQRFEKSNKYSYNSEIEHPDIAGLCRLLPQATLVLEDSMERFKLNGRDYVKTIRIARTIADLSERENVEAEDISEALSYRSTSWRTEASF